MHNNKNCNSTKSSIPFSESLYRIIEEFYSKALQNYFKGVDMWNNKSHNICKVMHQEDWHCCYKDWFDFVKQWDHDVQQHTHCEHTKKNAYNEDCDVNGKCKYFDIWREYMKNNARITNTFYSESVANNVLFMRKMGDRYNSFLPYCKSYCNS